MTAITRKAVQKYCFFMIPQRYFGYFLMEMIVIQLLFRNFGEKKKRTPPWLCQNEYILSKCHAILNVVKNLYT